MALSPDLSMPRSKGMVIGFWIVTALFCLQIGFTAYAQLRFPQVSEAFTHLGFPAYFRVELSLAKLLGVVLLLAPVPARLKEWAYAGFAIDLGSALPPGAVGLGGGHRRSLGALVLLLAPPAGHAGERRGPVCAVAAFKAHCRMGFWKADVLRKGPAAAQADKPSARSAALYRRSVDAGPRAACSSRSPAEWSAR